jgi:hypothetical protein
LTLEQINEKAVASTMTNKFLLTILSNAQAVVVYSNAPPLVDYRLAADPYLAKFGPKGRMVEVKKSIFVVECLHH